MKDPCVFCLIAEENPPYKLNTPTVLYSDEHIVVFLDIQPLISSRAHTLVIPRKHYEKLSNLDSKISSHIGNLLPCISKVVCETVNTNDFNLVQNNGILAGQIIPHVHFHIVPRFPFSSSLSSNNFPDSINYQSLVFVKGIREDLDDDDISKWVPTIRSKLSLYLKSKL